MKSLASLMVVLCTLVVHQSAGRSIDSQYQEQDQAAGIGFQGADTGYAAELSSNAKPAPQYVYPVAALAEFRYFGEPPSKAKPAPLDSEPEARYIGLGEPPAMAKPAPHYPEFQSFGPQGYQPTHDEGYPDIRRLVDQPPAYAKDEPLALQSLNSVPEDAGQIVVSSVVPSDLEELYKQKVVLAEQYERPLVNGFGLKHAGVIVTLADGRRFLVRKGDEFGARKPTRVEDVRIMTDAWKRKESKKIEESTVGEFVKAGGPKYNFIFDNSFTAAARMMSLV